MVATTYQFADEQAWSVCDTLYALTFHASFATKYGAWFHIPFGSDVTYCGCAHAAEPDGGAAD
jgi:hypothetical protein